MANASPSLTLASISTASANISGHRCLVSTQPWHDWKGQAIRHRVLKVDDDPQTLRYVRDALVGAGYAPIVTGDPEEVLCLVEEYRPHLVLLDLVLPGTDGIDLMKDIAEMTDVPVIFLSAYGQDRLVARAFDMGAADYVVKPFSPTELSARIRAALRRREAPKPSEPYVLGDLSIDYDERRVTLAGRPVELTAKEYGTLVELSANAGRVLTYETLRRRVWGLDADVRPMRTFGYSVPDVAQRRHPYNHYRNPEDRLRRRLHRRIRKRCV